jgi:hypothetical protein
MAPNGGPQQPIAATILKAPKRPPLLAEHHWAELQASAIPADLAALNARTFGFDFADAAREREVLLHEAKAQAGDQPGHAYRRLLSLDAAYGHMLDGGWRFVGDAIPGFEPFHCWKPDQPRLSRDGKRIKYEHRPKAPTGLLLPQVSRRVWELVAERHSLPMPADCSGGFWAWVLATPELPIVITEGAKKTLCLLGLGFAAIGLPGVHNGRRVPVVDSERKPDQAHLIPELEALARNGRRFVICFDRDAKASTALKVDKAAVLLGHLLEAAGCEATVARIPERWWEDKTGVDDAVADGLGDEVVKALADPLELSELTWEHQLKAERRISPTITTYGRRLVDCPELSAPPSAGIVAIRSAKGSGKTELLSRWLASEPEVVAICHRRSLGASLANRLGLQWRNDLDAAGGRSFNEATGEQWEGLPPRLALCLDSLLALGDPAKYENAVLVLDEYSQSACHGLTSTTTNCVEHRGALLQRLQGLIRHCKRVILLDADLADPELRWAMQARGGGEVALIDNPTKPTPWPVRWWEHSGPEAIQQALIDAVKAGERPLVVTDSRKQATALNGLLEATTGKRGALVTRETVEQAEIQALLPRLNDPEAVKDLAWLVASPSISSGVSIEHQHFTAVYGLFFGGSLDDAEAAQALARVRRPVAREVWVSKASTAHNPVSRAWWAPQAEADLRQRWSTEAELMRRALAPDLLADAPLQLAEAFSSTVGLWAAFTARRNLSHSHLRSFVLARLRHEGHTITREAEPLEQADDQALRQLKTELKAARDDATAKAIAQAPVITKAEAADLMRRQCRTPSQQASIQRRAICERLALPPEQLTPELVTWSTWSSAARRLMLLLNPDLAAAADLQQLKASSADGGVLPWDQGFRLERSKWGEALGLRAFVEKFCRLDGPAWDASTPEVLAIAKVARDPRYRQQVANAFGIQINGSSDPVKLVASLLRKLGITTEAKRSGSSARTYRPEPEQLKTVLETAERQRLQAICPAPAVPDPLIHPEHVEHSLEPLEHPEAPPEADAGGGWCGPSWSGSMQLDEQLGIGPLATSDQLPCSAAGAPTGRSAAPASNGHQPCAGLDSGWTRRPPRRIQTGA